MNLFEATTISKTLVEMSAYAAQSTSSRRTSVSARPLSQYTQFDIDTDSGLAWYRTQIEFLLKPAQRRLVEELCFATPIHATRMDPEVFTNDPEHIDQATYCFVSSDKTEAVIECIHYAHRSNSRVCGQIHRNDINEILGSLTTDLKNVLLAA